jgi:hypothetical protein
MVGIIIGIHAQSSGWAVTVNGSPGGFALPSGVRDNGVMSVGNWNFGKSIIEKCRRSKDWGRVFDF